MSEIYSGDYDDHPRVDGALRPAAFREPGSDQRLSEDAQSRINEAIIDWIETHRGDADSGPSQG